MSSSRFLRSGINWARNSHSHRGFAFTQEDLGTIVNPSNRNERKKRKRADSSLQTEGLLVGNDLLDSAFLGIGGIGADLPALDGSLDAFPEAGDSQFSFAPLEDTYTDSLGLDQDIASTLSTPFPLSPQLHRSKKHASAKKMESNRKIQRKPKKERSVSSAEEQKQPVLESGDNRSRKNFRERQRRETMKKKFDELTALIENGEIEKIDQIPKMKKMDVLSKAIGTIKELQEQVQQFQMDRYRMAVMLKEQQNSRSRVSRSNDIDGFLKKMDIDLDRADSVIGDR
jgi:hypothetical protein